MFTGYEKILQSQLIELAKTERPVVLFGTTSLGRMAQGALKELGNPAVCYCDNQVAHFKLQGQLVNGKMQGLPVLSPEEAFKQYPQAAVVLCAFYKETRSDMERQAKDLGVQVIFQPQALLYAYQTRVLSRSSEPDFSRQIAETIQFLEINNSNWTDERLVLEQVNGLVSEICTLKCRYCGLGIPYIKSPRHYDADISIEAVEKLSESVDAINFYGIVGGEALLHPQIVDICRETAKMGNILQISILTNGAWLPKKEVLAEVSKYITKIIISDYGPEVSIKKDKLKALCEECDLICEEKPENLSTWYDTGQFQNQNRSTQQNNKVFYECWENMMCCPSICEDQFYVCVNSFLGNQHFNVPIAREDSIRLVEGNNDWHSRRKQLIRLLQRKNAPLACGYCNGIRGKQVTPGEQI